MRFSHNRWRHFRGEAHGRIVGIEEELQGPVVGTCPDLLARLDLLTVEEGALVVTDFKTSRGRWSAAQVEEAADQLLLYHGLAMNLAPDLDVRLRFVVLTKTKDPQWATYSVRGDPGRVGRAVRVLECVWAAIVAGHFYPTPSVVHCGGCPFREACSAWHG